MLLEQTQNTYKDIEENIDIVFILGEHQVFKTHMLKNLKDNFIPRARRRVARLTELKAELNIVRYKPFFRGKWFMEVDFAGITESGKKQMLNYHRDPSKHCLVVVLVDDYRDRRRILKSKGLINAKNVGIIDYTYPKRDFLEQYINSTLTKPIVPTATRLLRKRLSDSYDQYPEYIHLLNQLPYERIYDEQIKEIVPDLSKYDEQDLVESIVKLHRKTIPNKALHSILEESTPRFLLNKLKHDFSLLLQAKELCLEGFIIADGNLHQDLAKLKEMQLNLDYPIINYPPYIVNKYIKLAEHITRKELIAIDFLLSRYSHINEEQLRILIYTLLGRRELTENQTMELLDITI